MPCIQSLVKSEKVCFFFRFLGSNLRILPVRNNTDIVKGMLTIAKVKIVSARQTRRAIVPL